MGKIVKGFIFNDFLVSVQEDGEVKVFTNNLEKQKEAKQLRLFFNGQLYNEVSICFDSVEKMQKYFSLIQQIYSPSFRKLHNENAFVRGTLEQSINRVGNVTIYTCNGFLQHGTGRSYAENHNFKIFDMEKLKEL